MKENKLIDMSFDELISKEKKLKMALVVLVGAIGVLLIACIIITLMKGFEVFTIMPIVFLPIILASFSNLKEIQNEIKSRSV